MITADDGRGDENYKSDKSAGSLSRESIIESICICLLLYERRLLCDDSPCSRKLIKSYIKHVADMRNNSTWLTNFVCRNIALGSTYKKKTLQMITPRISTWRIISRVLLHRYIYLHENVIRSKFIKYAARACQRISFFVKRNNTFYFNL